MCGTVPVRVNESLANAYRPHTLASQVHTRGSTRRRMDAAKRHTKCGSVRDGIVGPITWHALVLRAFE